MDSTAQVLNLIQSGGVVGLLTLIVMGALREWWVPGSVHKRLEKSRDQWQQYAMRSLETADKAVRLADQEDGI